MTEKPTTRTSLSSGRYSIVRRIGSGGMGEVFLATDRNLDSKVVIKIPHASMLRDAEFAARFQLEIRSLVRLRHRSIVSIMDVGEEKGVPFAVMQYLEGGSLEDRLKDGPLPESSLQRWLPDVASALDFIHREGYVHRDIKPANILFDREGNAYVSDFGVAKVIDKSAAKQQAAATMTGAGMIMGTPDYMAPELIMGERFDHRVDQYALAVTVFEALSGRRPFEAPTPSAMLIKHSTVPAPSLKTRCQGASLQAVTAVDRVLSKRPSSRYETCSQFCSAVLNSGNAVTPPLGSSSQGAATSAVKLPGISCPLCGYSMRLGSQHAGKTIRCTGCQATLKVADDLSGLTQKTATTLSSSDAELSSLATRTNQRTRNGHEDARRAVVTGNSILSARWLTPAIAAMCVLTLGIVWGVHSSRREQTGGNTLPSQAALPAAVQAPAVVPSPPPLPLPASTAPAPVAAVRILPDSSMTVLEEAEIKFALLQLIEGVPPGTGRFRLAASKPEGMSIDPVSGLVQWTPSENQGPGEFPVVAEFAAADGQAFSSQKIVITVEEINKPPVLPPIPYQRVLPGGTLELSLSAVDPDLPANRVTYEFASSAMPEWQLDTSTGQFKWQISAIQPPGHYAVSMNAIDEHGAKTPVTISIFVDSKDDYLSGVTMEYLKTNGLFGFPLLGSKTVCNTKELRLSVAWARSELLVQAILWNDTHDERITAENGLQLGDRSIIQLDLDGDLKPTKGKDREYFLNKTRSQPGMHYTVVTGITSRSAAQWDTAGRGCIRHIPLKTGQRIRVDTYAIPLHEVGLSDVSTISLTYTGLSESPRSAVSSINTSGSRQPHVVKLHELRMVTTETTVPNGRWDPVHTQRPLSIEDFNVYGEYEEADLNRWSNTSWVRNYDAASVSSSSPYAGRQAVKISSVGKPDDFLLVLPVMVVPNARYRFSGWVRTTDVVVNPTESRSVGACLSIDERDEASESVLGTSEWKLITWDFDAGLDSVIWVGCRLGHRFSTCTGTAWFDNLHLEKLDE